jgi:hypothetical protein
MKKTKKIGFFLACLLGIAEPVFSVEILRFEWISDRDGLDRKSVV